MLFEILAKDDDPAPPASGWELSSFDGAASLGHRPAESSGDLVDAQNQLPRAVCCLHLWFVVAQGQKIRWKRRRYLFSAGVPWSAWEQAGPRLHE